MQVVGQA